MLFDEQDRHVGRYYGKYRGKVADNVDDGFQGRLMVTVPGVFGAEAVVSAVPCMPYGHFFVPPVDTDVWVEFEGGDPRSALWVGVWYPEGTAPEEAQVATPDHRVIQTKAGHTVEIVDVEGEEKILIRHASEAFVSIDHTGAVTLANKNGSQVQLDAEDTLHVKASKVVLDAKSVAAGSGASEPTLMGKAFEQLWQLVLTHTHPTAMGPAGPSPELAAAKLVAGVHLTDSVTVK